MKKSTMNDFIEALTKKKGTSAYDTQAEVVRVDGSTAWVHIPGGVDETPVRMTINAKPGDTVQVRVGGGRAWLTGNGSAPPTDDARAIVADTKADGAMAAANSAVQSASIAKDAADSAIASAAEAEQAAQDAQDSLMSVVQGATTVEKAVSVMQTALEAVVDYDPNAKQGTFTGDGTETDFALTERATNILSVTVDGESVEYTSAVTGGVTVITITPAPDNGASVVVSYDTTQEFFWHDANGAHVLGDTSGYRNDIDSSGMRIVDTSTEESVADFGTGVRLGLASGKTLNVDSYGLVLKDNGWVTTNITGGNSYFCIEDITTMQEFTISTNGFTFFNDQSAGLTVKGADVSASGDITAGGDVTATNIYTSKGKIGERVSSEPSAVSAESGKYYQAGSLPLTPGMWVIICAAEYASSGGATGIRRSWVVNQAFTNGTTTEPSGGQGYTFNDRRAGIASNPVDTHGQGILNITANTTLRQVVYQNSGQRINVIGRMYAVRIA